jgi:hypothetical protein
MAKRVSPKRKRCRTRCKSSPKTKRAACVRKCMSRKK